MRVAVCVQAGVDAGGGRPAAAAAGLPAGPPATPRPVRSHRQAALSITRQPVRTGFTIRSFLEWRCSDPVTVAGGLALETEEDTAVFLRYKERQYAERRARIRQRCGEGGDKFGRTVQAQQHRPCSHGRDLLCRKQQLLPCLPS